MQHPLCLSSRSAFEGSARYAAIHPLSLSLLCYTFAEALAQAADVARGSQVFAPLWYTVTWQDLARIPWEQLAQRLRALATKPAGQLEGVVEQVCLFAGRAVLHHRLYLAKSGTTLKLLRKCYLPSALPLELIDFAVEFDGHLREMDKTLRTGRASLDHFQRQALLGEPLPALRAILAQAQACAEAYSSAYNAAYQIAEGVDEYLAWRASQREQQAGGERHSTSATLPHASPTSGEMSERSSAQPPGAARLRDAHSTGSGGFTVTPGSPESALAAFCATCPPPPEVVEALAGLGFTLTFSMEGQHSPAYSRTPPIPAQFHFRDEHGTEVIYLAGKDAGEGRARLPSHASRFWLYPGASVPATQLVSQFCATRWRLVWEESNRGQKREAVA